MEEERYQAKPGVIIELPFAQKRLDTVNILAQAINSLAKALQSNVKVDVQNCNFTATSEMPAFQIK